MTTPPTTYISDPCVMCGHPVEAESMGGRDICPSCDCGIWRNGVKWTMEDFEWRFDESAPLGGRLHLDRSRDPLRTHCEDGECAWCGAKGFRLTSGLCDGCFEAMRRKVVGE